MAKDPAKWRDHMTDSEREEIDSAVRSRDAAADVLRAITRRIKDRCIKRMRRAKPGE